MQSRSVRRIVRCVLFVLCSFAALSATGAVGKPPLPEVVHLEHNGAFYKIDYSDFTRNRLSRALDGGCYEISFSRRSGDDPSLVLPFDGLDSQGASILDAPAVSGDTTWIEVLTRTICLDDWGVTIRDAAGPDNFEVSIPKAALLSAGMDIPGDVMATISVNGHVEELDPILLYQTGVEDRVEFANLVWHYSEDGWYHQVLPLFQTMQEEVADRYLIPELDGPVSMGCWQPCATCGISAIGTVVGGTALAAACATTFGATCVGGAVGVVSLALRTVMACDECRVCRGEDPEPECSTGYSPCCEDQCCKDDTIEDCDSIESEE